MKFARIAAVPVGIVLDVLLAVTLLAALATQATAPHGNEWQLPLRLGSTHLNVSAAKFVQMAMHPVLRSLIDGAATDTRSGRWQLRAESGDDAFEAQCQPCALPLRALGPAPWVLERVEFRVQPAGPGQWKGTLRLSSNTESLALGLRASLGTTGTHLEFDLPPTPASTLVHVLGAALPESHIAIVEGVVAVTARFDLPSGEATIDPRVDGLSVAGLGTDRLRDVELPSGCGSGGVRGWLPLAVIAAEDQRFYQHPAYDLDELQAAITGNQSSGGRLRGGSTLTQQLAKRIYAGDQRSPLRKLRELLYAVEMERTLGKARILQLYLALAPWGAGTCGAEAAAQRFLGKPASALEPAEAAWLASLLVNPERRLEQQSQAGVDQERVRRVLFGMRPTSSRERRALRRAWRQYEVQVARDP